MPAGAWVILASLTVASALICLGEWLDRHHTHTQRRGLFLEKDGE